MHLTSKYLEGSSQRAFLLGTEDFGNLGDHQIAVSELEFLHQYFNKVIEVPASKYFADQRMLINEISPQDTIFLTGGGNFGNVYPTARKIRNDVIRKWRKNKKIIMPQTAYYTNNKEGKHALKKDKKLLTQKNCITITAREEISYSFLKEHFHCNIILTPDIVLFSSCGQIEKERKDIALLCLRNDLESVLSEAEKWAFEKLMYTNFSKVEHIDMQKSYDIKVSQRDAELHEMFAKLESVSIVVTDRLHGMIFCAITGTPCLVLENYNHKIRSSYAWVSFLPYIKLVKDAKEVEEMLGTKFWKKKYTYDSSVLADTYDVIIKALD